MIKILIEIESPSKVPRVDWIMVAVIEPVLTKLICFVALKIAL
jgi:hypothetical protein